MSITIMSPNIKYQIFEHVIDSYLYIAIQSGFKCGTKDNKYVFSGYPSPIFNFLYLSKQDDLLSKTVNDSIPFMCFPQKELENEFGEIAQKNGLAIIDNVIAHRFDIDNNWNYQPSLSIEFVKIQNNNQLTLFDEISSECFEHPKGLAYNFLEKVVAENNMCEMFLAYHKGTPVGTVMISFTNNIAGIYWLATLPLYRNKGIATEMTHYAINYAVQKGYRSVISQNLTPSQSLFQKIGFQPYGVLPLYAYISNNN